MSRSWSDEQTKQLFKRAMVAAIPLHADGMMPKLGTPFTLQGIRGALDLEEALNAYTRLASPNFLWPKQQFYTDESYLPIPSNLPNECVMNGANDDDHYHIGDSIPYSSILRFTMIRDDDPYGQGVPAGSVGYWTLPLNSTGKHLNSSCFIDGAGQIHGIQWEGLNSNLAITGDQDYKVEIILIGANCSWPESWDALFNGYVNAALNTVCQIHARDITSLQKGEREHQAMLMSQIAGIFQGDGFVENATLGDHGSWETLAGIWRQSQNVRIAPTLPTTDPTIIRKLGNWVVEDYMENQPPSLTSLINRRLI